MLKKKLICLQLVIACLISVTACTTTETDSSSDTSTTVESSIEVTSDKETSETSTEEETSVKEEVTSEVTESTTSAVIADAVAFDFSSIPSYSGEPYYVVNDNTPFFDASEVTSESYEYYSPLDNLGRCGTAVACVGMDIMPTEERGSIGSVKPTGWQSVRYDCVDGSYLYNRCHLIGYQLTGENANTSNLITGTRYLNVDGMLPFENMVADFVKETEMHVMYRSTPYFEGENLLASGVLLEAMSVEDNGEGVLFNVYVYNVQPDIEINYATGESKLVEEKTTGAKLPSAPSEETVTEAPAVEEAKTNSYVLNTNTKKVHKPSCSSVDTIKDGNRQDYEGTLAELEAQGYTACGRCHPF